jgi:hypothetical protein
MTNILTSIVITFVLITNWTGVQFNGKELGYTVTNHVAVITYQGGTNQFTLKSGASDVAVWRTPIPSMYMTNYWHFPTNQCYTNFVLTNIMW